MGISYFGMFTRKLLTLRVASKATPLFATAGPLTLTHHPAPPSIPPPYAPITILPAVPTPRIIVSYMLGVLGSRWMCLRHAGIQQWGQVLLETHQVSSG
jgi:hypothetical protein